MVKIPKRRRPGQRRRLPKNLAEFDALPRRSQLAVENVAHVVTRMRAGLSLNSAATEHGVAPRTVVRLGGPALRKTAGGRYAAKAGDNLLRVFRVPVHGGSVEVAVRGSRASTIVAERAQAQREYLATGDVTKLRKLSKTTVLDASGREVPFLTDLDELDRQGDLGTLSFESIYARRG
jgi:hypothetical protein